MSAPPTRFPALLGWLVNPLARRGYHTGALALLFLVLAAVAGAAGWGLLTLALTDGMPPLLMLVGGLAGSLLALCASLTVTGLVILAPALIISTMLEGQRKSS
ncbi:hypothetical protein [Streptomyces violascens]|uniref:hypothetical protein n=1 Tax=Streptomyces violascens TaxID=67381 RepID=UPI00167250FE|nr:hypothetical protein [Streptomyces violascens]GGU50012.1 hypothetical protein GCM10010289_83140 [Streptomyces violascens]